MQHIIKLSNFLNEKKITLDALATLAVLWDKGEGSSMGSIADALGFLRPRASHNIDQLESRKLVARKPWKEDRRVVMATVTPKGYDLIKEYESIIDSK